jgi:predicted HicB family RNase H-like nuclease
MNIMEHDGYKARIEYDPELDHFRGEILGINGLADFYGKNTRQLHSEFRKSLRLFVEVCAEKGVEPRRAYSGKFNLRVSEELHERIAVRAAADGVSLNSWVVGVLRESI